MSGPRRIAFVARNFSGESLLSARAITKLENVELFGICDQPFATDETTLFREVVGVADTHDSDQLIATAKQLQQKHGPLNRIVTTYETLLEPVAQTVEALSLEGMSVATVRRALNKSSLIATLKEAGVGTARSLVCTAEAQARSFTHEVGYPVVLKPLNGSGGLATWAIRDDSELSLALELTAPSPARPLLIEECLFGKELCIDTITIANEPRVYSICCYTPSILGALQNPAIQWCCVMPRDISDEFYQPVIAQGLDAVRALSVGDAMTHMEAFLLADGRVCFTDATLRPAGARIAPMLAYAYDIDPYFAWARATLDGCFDGPWTRKYAVGTIFLRGAGSGTVESVTGFEIVERKLRETLADVRLPRAGAVKASTYTGDGYITVRHPETAVVEEALDFIAQTVDINYSSSESSATLRDEWNKRLQYNRLYKPVWEIDSHTRM
ncbi:MAG TPA: ATP-grasp domain-containing protein [Pyrinomonadaceae bacterium]|nr:ATP-grasp domain-containing protein [Pyrinomonadaceae bacterium]